MTSKENNILDVKVKDYGECGFCKEGNKEENLDIPWDIWSQWKYISQYMGNKEWGAVFTVKNKTIKEFKIPEQEVTGTECEFKEELGGEGIVHSHHAMGAFHSGQDDAHARNLYSYSIVLSSTGSVSTKKIKLPCGGFGYVKVNLILINCPKMDINKIKEKQYIQTNGTQDNPRKKDDNVIELPCANCHTYECDNCVHVNTYDTWTNDKDTEVCEYCGSEDKNLVQVKYSEKETIKVCEECKKYMQLERVG